jgi:hypothetical protein
MMGEKFIFLAIAKGYYSDGTCARDHLLPMSQQAHDGREDYLFSHSKRILQLGETVEAQVGAQVDNHAEPFC